VYKSAVTAFDLDLFDLFGNLILGWFCAVQYFESQPKLKMKNFIFSVKEKPIV
jgi:hypothetical protein